jgi:hypothetical protein
MVQLSEDQKRAIREYLEPFLAWSKTSEGVEWQEDRQRREVYLSRIFARDRLPSLSDDDIRELVETLWAMQFWGNKEYITNKILSENTLDNLRTSFESLLYGEEDIATRWDLFRKSTKHFGPSSVSEILAFIFPDQFAIWNQKPITVLPFLGILSEAEVRKITARGTPGKDYAKVLEYLDAVREELCTATSKDLTFLDLDCYLAYIFYNVLKELPEQVVEERLKEPTAVEEGLRKIDLKMELTHQDVEGILLELGNLLGFSTYTADPSGTYRGKQLRQIARLKEVPAESIPPRHLPVVREIDVIWFDDDMVPIFCFEVEHTTDITKGLLRLYPLTPFPQAKFVILAPHNMRGKFQREMKRPPFSSVRDRYLFRSYKELVRFANQAADYFQVYKRFFVEK